MSGGHAHALYHHASSPVHDLPPQVKVAAMLLFVLGVVATPRAAFIAFGGYAVALVAVTRIARVPIGRLLKRMLVGLPFFLFALFLPIVGTGPRVDVLGVPLAVEGLWGMWTILAKSILGIAASILMASTTDVADVLAGLDRLRAPRVITAIAGFMLRYLDVITGELRRMRTAMLSRGYDPRWLWQTRALTHSAGALFIRSYQRGERVFNAMVARGYQGHMPNMGGTGASAGQWAAGLTLPALAWIGALVSVVVLR